MGDQFSFYCQKTGKFEYVNEAFVVEPAVFEKAFREWIDNKKDLPMPRKELIEYMESLKDHK